MRCSRISRSASSNPARRLLRRCKRRHCRARRGPRRVARPERAVMGLSRSQRFRRGSSDEEGFVLVWVSVLMVVLLVCAALVVDLGNARQQQTQAQAVADTAALSGASGLTDTTPDAEMQAFTYAFKSRSLPPPTSLQA